MLFPGNKRPTDCKLVEVSRSPPPPLPNGYVLGEKLYFVGIGQSLDDGDRVVHGQVGEVIGPVLDGLNKGGLTMIFPGNKTSRPIEYG